MFKTTLCTVLLLAGAQALPAIEIDATLHALAADNYRARQDARLELRNALAAVTDPGANPEERASIEQALIATAQPEEPAETRLFVIQQLGRFGQPSVAEALFPLLGDADARVADAARVALMHHTGNRATEQLHHALKYSEAPPNPPIHNPVTYRG
ncbi:MAG: HEAT repeat domain-containing protein, partial [Opitutales bacterium]